MCRVLAFLSWKAEWWVEWQGSRDVGGDEGLAEGLCSFARDQQKIQLLLKAKFETMWKAPLEDMEVTLGDTEADQDEADEGESSDNSDSDDGLEDVVDLA